MPTSNDPTLVVSSKPYQSAQTSKTSEHAHYGFPIWKAILITREKHGISFKMLS